MKKLLTLIVVVCCAMVFQSCSKNSSNDFSPPETARPDRTITAKLGPGQVYTVSIDNVGELRINNQASHFKVSETRTNPQTGTLTYSYSPADGFKGTDEVLLAHKTEYIYSSNSSCSYGSNSAIGNRTSYIAVKITVVD